MAAVKASQHVLLVGALSLAVGWLAGNSSSSLRSQDAPSASPRTGPRALGARANPAPMTKKLHDRLEVRPARTPSVGRNPFVFGARRPSMPVRQASAPMAAPPAMTAAPHVPPPPQFRLSGIASSQQEGVTVLTAILIDNGSMTFVKSGDQLSNGFSVVRVEESGVVLVDAAGIAQTLRLP